MPAVTSARESRNATTAPSTDSSPTMGLRFPAACCVVFCLKALLSHDSYCSANQARDRLRSRPRRNIVIANKTEPTPPKTTPHVNSVIDHERS